MDKQQKIQDSLLERLDFEKYLLVSQWIIDNIDSKVSPDYNG